MDLSIVGIGTASINPAEYTDPFIIEAYLDKIRILKSILDKRSSNTDGEEPVGPLTIADYNNLIGAVQALANFARNGISHPDGSVGYLNLTMANQLNDIMKSLKVVGISSSSPLILATDPQNEQDEAIALVQQWQALAGYGVEKMLTDAISTFTTYTATVKTTTGVSTIIVEASPTRTLQSMVELEYVKNANELIFSRLESLEEALTLTQSILDTLTLIATISNQIQISGRQPPFAFPPTVDAEVPPLALSALFKRGERAILSTYPLSGQFASFADVPVGLTLKQWYSIDAANNFTTNYFGSAIAQIVNTGDHNRFYDYYKIIASAYFSQLYPSAIPSQFNGVDLLNAKQTLAAQLSELQALNPGAAVSATSLASNLMKVIQDISTYFVTSISVSAVNSAGFPSTTLRTVSLSAGSDPALLHNALVKWILDSQDVALGAGVENKAGLIQDNIQAAIRTAGNLNDTQKEEVRRYMFLFEEFYKSASAVLQKITQIVEKLAQGISR